jgi:predicted transcriptional regulator
MSTDTVNRTLRLPVELNDRLSAISEAQHRSVHATMVAALEAFVEANDHKARVTEAAERVAVKHAELLARLA